MRSMGLGIGNKSSTYLSFTSLFKDDVPHIYIYVKIMCYICLITWMTSLTSSFLIYHILLLLLLLLIHQWHVFIYMLRWKLMKKHIRMNINLVTCVIYVYNIYSFSSLLSNTKRSFEVNFHPFPRFVEERLSANLYFRDVIIF